MIHTAHPELIARPFANWPASIPLPQDVIRQRMIASIGRKPTPRCERQADVVPPHQQGGSAHMLKRAAERAALAPLVRDMKQAGASQHTIAKGLNISRERVRAIMAEAGI